MMLKTLPALAALAAAAVLVIPTVSFADDSVSMRVSYADLNLASSLGQSALQHRIGAAARSVCGAADARDLDYVRAVTDCRTGAIEGAQPAFAAAVASQVHGTVTVGAEAALVVSAH